MYKTDETSANYLRPPFVSQILCFLSRHCPLAAKLWLFLQNLYADTEAIGTMAKSNHRSQTQDILLITPSRRVLLKTMVMVVA